MSKKGIQKATFKDLLARKIQKEKDQFKSKDIEVSSLGKTLTFVKPKDDLVLEVIDEMGDGKSTAGMVQAFKTLIYHTCPMLQDTELHSELEIQDPDEVVSTIFDISDIMEIGQELMDLVNITAKVDEIKN
ncbi:hypothetical protein ACN077_20735 [Clostridium chromiireducens]|uniref:hypothetical protein n=1 Tax=Clostridium chromiireducens TaxID=225345 RepID=UPI003AF6942E